MAPNMIINIASFGILTLLGLGFAGALLFNQVHLGTAWQMVWDMPIPLQFVVGLLLLPLVLGLAWATNYTFLPKQALDHC